MPEQKYVLTAGINLPREKDGRFERGEEITPADFPNETSFKTHLKMGVVVKAGSADGKAALKDAPKKGGK